jgi:hypothetical protein
MLWPAVSAYSRGYVYLSFIFHQSVEVIAEPVDGLIVPAHLRFVVALTLVDIAVLVEWTGEYRFPEKKSSSICFWN